MEKGIWNKRDVKSGCDGLDAHLVANCLFSICWSSWFLHGFTKSGRAVEVRGPQGWSCSGLARRGDEGLKNMISLDAEKYLQKSFAIIFPIIPSEPGFYANSYRWVILLYTKTEAAVISQIIISVNFSVNRSTREESLWSPLGDYHTAHSYHHIRNWNKIICSKLEKDILEKLTYCIMASSFSYGIELAIQIFPTLQFTVWFTIYFIFNH